MTRKVFALATGFVFGSGLAVSGVVRPEAVLGFFRPGPEWDPALGLMFAGALLVTAPVTAYLRRRGRTLLGEELRFFHGPVDRRLVAGSLVFGAGWGLGGICPGPGVTAALTFSASPLAFLVGMMASIALYPRLAMDGRSALAWLRLRWSLRGGAGAAECVSDPSPSSRALLG